MQICPIFAGQSHLFLISSYFSNFDLCCYLNWEMYSVASYLHMYVIILYMYIQLLYCKCITSPKLTICHSESKQTIIIIKLCMNKHLFKVTGYALNIEHYFWWCDQCFWLINPLQHMALLHGQSQS